MLNLPKVLISAAITSLLTASTVSADETKTWELRGGQQWEQVKTPATTQSIVDPELTHIETLIEGKQAPVAKRLAVQWFKTHGKDAPLRERALFLLGQANYTIGDRIDAFYNFDELLDLYPESRYFYPALQRQYDIADSYLNGYPRVVLWVFDVGASEEAIEMLFRIQQRSPGSPLAEKALLRTADYYYGDSQFDLASDTYNAFVKSYPRSPQIPRVRLRQAFSNYAQFRGLKFDVTPIIDAREQLAAIEAQYPAMAAEENLQPVIDRIDATFARKIFVTGDFYERTHELRAAAYQYKFLLKTYPRSPDAKVAQNRLDHLPPHISKSIDPPGGNGYGPATAPSADSR